MTPRAATLTTLARRSAARSDVRSVSDVRKSRAAAVVVTPSQRTGLRVSDLSAAPVHSTPIRSAQRRTSIGRFRS